jgi:hypothetical protein
MQHSMAVCADGPQVFDPRPDLTPQFAQRHKMVCFRKVSADNAIDVLETNSAHLTTEAVTKFSLICEPTATFTP